MKREKLEYYSHLTVTVLGFALVLFVLLKYLLIPVLPFLIAWGVALAIRPASARLSRLFHIPQRVISAVLAILAVALGIGAVVGIFALLLNQAWQLISGFLEDERLYSILNSLINPIFSIFGDGEWSGEIGKYLGESVRSALSGLLTSIVNLLTSIVKRVPAVLFFILITAIAAVYFAIDIDKVNSSVKRLLPQRVVNHLTALKASFTTVGIRYIRSYLTLMLITLFMMLLGLLILGVKNAFLIAIVLAVLDLLPLIGVGTVLVPWSIIELLMGNTYLGVGLIVLFVVSELVRQLLEPKIVGKSLGLHPIISLVLLYVGYSLLGFLGLILAPLFSVVFNVIINKNNAAKVGE